MMNHSSSHPNLYEVNTRVLLRQYCTADKRVTVKDIPDEYWQALADKGIDWVWLLGVWSLKEKEIDENVIPEHMMEDFRKILPDLKDEDIPGSTFAIDEYAIDAVIGTEEEFKELRSKLNSIGIKLMLDFIPNHFGAHTHWLRTHPEYFIEVGEAAHNIDPTTFYTPITLPGKYFAHGKDPYFDAWQDTVQVDYTFHGTREWMTGQILRIAELCDGLRCDMAMLPVKRVFEQTWQNYVKWNGPDFWPEAISKVKEVFPEFVFLAEVYWDMEAELLDQGFDYCYDKTFYDRLEEPKSLKAHFNADTWYLDRTARFLENHDEKRIASTLSLRQHMAAAALVAFSPGMRFWHMGQWEGRTVKIPVQLNRWPEESCGCVMWQDHVGVCQCVSQFYDVLHDLSQHEVVARGSWEHLNQKSEEENTVLIWQWTYENQSMLIVVNYSDGEFVLDRDSTGIPDHFFEDQIFPKPSDAFDGKKLRPWDVRIWLRTKD